MVEFFATMIEGFFEALLFLKMFVYSVLAFTVVLSLIVVIYEISGVFN